MHGKVRPGNACPVAVINLLTAQERRPEPTHVVKPLDLFRQGPEHCVPVPEDCGQYVSRYCTTSKTKPTVGVLRRRMRGTLWQYKAHKSRMTVPQKKYVPQQQAFPNGMKTAVKWLMSESQRCTCRHDLETVLNCEQKSKMSWQARS